MSIIVPPIKIQGKKTKLLTEIYDLVNEIADKDADTWVEPFLGSGIVSFNSSEQFKKVICGDINPYVIEFYNGIKEGKITSDIVRSVLTKMGEELSKFGNEYYLKIRKEFNETHDILLFLFLTRTCFNGVMRFNSKGEFNVPFCNINDRLNSKLINTLCDNIDQLKDIMDKRTFVFLKQSFEDTIAIANEHSVIYCDPPYFGLNTTYYDKWSEEGETKLRKALDESNCKNIISTWKYNGLEENKIIEKYWGDYNIRLIDHQYCVGPKGENRRKVVEALLYK